MRSAFSNSHPAVIFIFFISVAVFSVVTLHPVMLSMLFACALICNIYYKGKSALKMLLSFLLPTLIFVTLINTLFSHYGVTVLYTLKNGNAVTLEALVYGLVLGLRTVTVMLIFSNYNETVTSDKLTYILGKRFPTATLLISMTLRFIPVFFKRAKAVSQAQKGLGFGTGEEKLADKMKSAVREISTLITWSLENTVETADSMKSRGYSLKGRTFYKKISFGKRDFLMTVTMILCDVAAAVGILTGSVEATYNPSIVIDGFSAMAVISETGIFILSMLPFSVDVSEVIIWNRSKSKI